MINDAKTVALPLGHTSTAETVALLARDETKIGRGVGSGTYWDERRCGRDALKVTKKKGAEKGWPVSVAYSPHAGNDAHGHKGNGAQGWFPRVGKRRASLVHSVQKSRQWLAVDAGKLLELPNAVDENYFVKDDAGNFLTPVTTSGCKRSYPQEQGG